MRTAVDFSKDQTYFLWGLTQAQLARTLFPLGALTKPEVRALASEFDLPVAKKAESYEICFVPNGDYAAFMDAYLREKGGEQHTDPAGEIRHVDGRTLGKHAGAHNFTVGQRKGLGIAARDPLYVIATEPAIQRVVVGCNDDLLRASLVAHEVNCVSIDAIATPRRAQVKIRNKHIGASATLTPTSDGTRVSVHFDEPQRAVTPGQAAVFYDGDLVLGGGWIEN